MVCEPFKQREPGSCHASAPRRGGQGFMSVSGKRAPWCPPSPVPGTRWPGGTRGICKSRLARSFSGLPAVGGWLLGEREKEGMIEEVCIFVCK